MRVRSRHTWLAIESDGLRRPIPQMAAIARTPNHDQGEEKSIAGSRHHEMPRRGSADSLEASTPWRRLVPSGARVLPNGSPGADTGYSSPIRAAGAKRRRLASARRSGDGRKRPGTQGCSSPGEYGYRRRPRLRVVRFVRLFRRSSTSLSSGLFAAAHVSPRSIRERCGSSSVQS